jgi:FkbM family methyltransferase
MSPLHKLMLHARFRLWAPVRANRHASFYTSHSQFGEDMVVRALLGDRRGIYVDIGAHHPVFYSNTYHFYRTGWRGINIDATPGSMEAFRALRPRDVNLEVCLAPRGGEEVEFVSFDLGAYNTLDAARAEAVASSGAARVVARTRMRTRTLGEVLDEHLPRGAGVDLLSLDIEGVDEMILRSNDWDRVRPECILFELHDVPMEQLAGAPLVRFLAEQGYALAGACGPTVIVQAVERRAHR